VRGGRDERGVLGAHQGVERARRSLIDEHVLPAEHAARADRLVEGDLIPIARRADP